MKGDDCFTVRCLKGQMNTGNLPVRLVYEQLIYVEVALALNKVTRPSEGRMTAR